MPARERPLGEASLVYVEPKGSPDGLNLVPRETIALQSDFIWGPPDVQPTERLHVSFVRAAGFHRLILANGIHRAAAAAMAGLDKIPLALCDLSQLELPEPFVETPRAMLLDPTFRPPMVSDSGDSKLSNKLSVYKPPRTVRFNWNFENYTVGIH
ncbi:MAG: hypothetical protein WCB19_04065 [Thermoplasmata archaeon]